MESSTQRLREKVDEAKIYIQKERHDINELTRLKKNLEKKRSQLEKDITEYQKASENDQEKIDASEDLKITAEDIYEDLEHYISITEKKQQQEAEERKLKLEAEKRKLEREAEERKLEREAEQRKLEVEVRKLKLEEEERKLRLEAEDRD